MFFVFLLVFLVHPPFSDQQHNTTQKLLLNEKTDSTNNDKSDLNSSSNSATMKHTLMTPNDDESQSQSQTHADSLPHASMEYEEAVDENGPEMSSINNWLLAKLASHHSKLYTRLVGRISARFYTRMSRKSHSSNTSRSSSVSSTASSNWSTPSSASSTHETNTSLSSHFKCIDCAKNDQACHFKSLAGLTRHLEAKHAFKCNVASPSGFLAALLAKFLLNLFSKNRERVAFKWDDQRVISRASNSLIAHLMSVNEQENDTGLGNLKKKKKLTILILMR